MNQINRYQIKAVLGGGGMALVYRAYDPRFRREVAIKVMAAHLLHDPQFRQRFEREAQVIASLQHPAIVPVYDFGEQNGQLYLVMGLMSGGSLASRLQGGGVALSFVVWLLERLAPALDLAHQKGVVHRDLKPDNILFDGQGNPYLADFGIAKLIQTTTMRLSQSGLVIGTPFYISPEQALGSKQIDGRSDIYSLGVIVFQMLTGQPPYDADTPLALAYKHIHEPVPNIVAVKPELPPSCQLVMRRALAKNPVARYATAGKMAKALKAALGRAKPAGIGQPNVPIIANPSARRPKAVPPSRRSTPQPVVSKQVPSQPTVKTRSWWLPWALFVSTGLLLMVVTTVVLLAISSGYGTDASTPTMVAHQTAPLAEAVQTTPTSYQPQPPTSTRVKALQTSTDTPVIPTLSNIPTKSLVPATVTLARAPVPAEASTPVPPTAIEPASTPVPPTAILVPTSTPVPPTATLVPTSTPIPPTATLVRVSTSIPTATFVPTSTPLPPTVVIPTNTPLPPPSAIPTVANTYGAEDYLNLGYDYLINGQYDQAISNFNEAIRLNPTYAEAYNLRGIAYRLQGNLGQAIADHHEAIRLAPTYIEAHYQLGNAYYDQANYEQAIAAYSETIRLGPTHAKAYSSRGLVHEIRGNREQAIADYNNALELNNNAAATQAAQAGLDRLGVEH